ncbi:hypothetical protein EJB05_48397, partial [Eragrostis curvula]
MVFGLLSLPAASPAAFSLVFLFLVSAAAGAGQLWAAACSRPGAPRAGTYPTAAAWTQKARAGAAPPFRTAPTANNPTAGVSVARRPGNAYAARLLPRHNKKRPPPSPRLPNPFPLLKPDPVLLLGSPVPSAASSRLPSLRSPLRRRVRK